MSQLKSFRVGRIGLGTDLLTWLSVAIGLSSNFTYLLTRKWPKNGLPAAPNRIGFLARHEDRRKCCGRGCMLVSRTSRDHRYLSNGLNATARTSPAGLLKIRNRP